MPFSSSIQMLYGTHSSTGAGAGCVADWSRNRAWIYGNKPYFSNINILTGNEDNWGNIPSQCNQTPMGLDANGDLYLSNGGLHSGGQTQFDGTTLVQVNTTQWANNIFGGGDIANVPVSGSQYMLDTGVGGSFGVLSAINVTLNTANIANQSWTWGPGSDVCSGPIGANYGFMLNGTNSNTAELFQVEVFPTPTQTLVGSYTPTSIDGTWTTISFKGLCIDSGDGNPIICFAGNGSTGTYITKVNGTTGAIIWNVPLPQNPNIGRDWKNTSIRYNTLYVMTPSNFGSPPVEFTTINTSTGSYSSSSSGLAGVNPVYGPQVSNDSLGAVALQCDYNQTGGSPTPLNSTPSSFTDRWALLYVAPGNTPVVATGTHASYVRIWGNMPR
jgi:hypothetical protein